ncbi:hypothetical protein DL93DRAFT_2083621 [Clavulina sp. PMI_390]|nr:hypothetical protein DL93DRAFT_2083621 [Clavulina sp. PMI_390]
MASTSSATMSRLARSFAQRTPSRIVPTASLSRSLVSSASVNALRQSTTKKLGALDISFDKNGSKSASPMSEAEQQSISDIANLASQADVRQKAKREIVTPDTQYRAVEAQTPIDPYSLKKSRMLKLAPGMRPPPRPRTTSRLGPPAAEALRSDPIAYFGLLPHHEVLNPVFLNEFLTDMGKIKGRNETKLTRKSQRYVGKAVRRARAMGILPTLHKAVVTSAEVRSVGGSLFARSSTVRGRGSETAGKAPGITYTKSVS